MKNLKICASYFVVHFINQASIFATLILTLSCSLTSFSVSATEKDVVRIAMAISPLSSPFIIAQEKGFFKELGVNVVIKQVKGGHLALKTVLDGDADIATSSEAVVMFNSFKQNDFRLFCTFVTSDNDVKILSRIDSAIDNINDLKGKKVGTILGTSAHFFLYYTLLMNGISEDEISTVNIKPHKAKELLENKEIDAVVTWEPFAYLVKKELGDRVKVVNHDRVYVETFNAITMRDYAIKNDKKLKKVTLGLIKATEYIKEHNKESMKIVAAVLSKDIKVIESTWPDFLFSVGLDQWLLTSLETEARWAIEHKFISAAVIPNYVDFINTSPLEQVAPEKITIFN